MAEITLADYTGYIFLEIIRAREMADRHSRALAQVYAADPVLQHFAVPRFKVPKMELTIPVLISGARFNQVISFRLPEDKFVAFVLGRCKEVVAAVRGRVIFKPVLPKAPVLEIRAAAKTGRYSKATAKAKAKAGAADDGATLEQLARNFHAALLANPDPSQPDTLVREYWSRLFELALTEQGLVEAYKKLNPDDALFKQTLSDVLATVRTATVIDSTHIQSLLINPETHVVKTDSSDTSVFTLKAEMLEEGFFIRNVRDDATGEVRQVVEFE